ncbi:MAG: GntR family transcriptional regulator [Spirochaetaceae bacterium]|jgi:DNA-binding GntR family transcriptional regulator|nr:GntR family transcriptional regulator [Spirochaetaceae bacterium]
MQGFFTTGRDRAGNVQDSVYSSLRDNIINLKLPPGTAISEKEISLRYKVSRTPVREAFIHLSKEGLVRVIPQKETLVSRIDFSRVEQELFLREQLEPATLKLFVKCAVPSHFRAMDELIALQAQAMENSEFVKFMQYDNDFHHIIYSGAGQELAWEVLNTMTGHYYRIRLLTVWLKGIASDILAEHRNLAEALKAKDFSTAATVLETHIHKLGDEKKLLRETFPGYFTDPDEPAFDVNFGGLVFS